MSEFIYNKLITKVKPIERVQRQQERAYIRLVEATPALALKMRRIAMGEEFATAQQMAALRWILNRTIGTPDPKTSVAVQVNVGQQSQAGTSTIDARLLTMEEREHLRDLLTKAKPIDRKELAATSVIDAEYSVEDKGEKEDDVEFWNEWCGSAEDLEEAWSSAEHISYGLREQDQRADPEGG